MIKILEQSENISHEYCCTVVKLGEIVPIEGSDFLGTAMVEGRTIVVRKDEVKEGNVMIYASNESQLNKDFLSINNQFEDKELNVDKEKKGYFNKYGRIRMIKLRGQVSMGYLFDKNALVTYCPKCASLDLDSMVGEDFDTVNGELFVKAYVPPVKEVRHSGAGNKRDKKLKKFNRMIEGQFAFHYDTQQLQRNMERIKPNDIVTITNKLHGTSFILGNVLVKKPKFGGLYAKIFNYLPTWLQFTVPDYDIVYSSRTVIKNANINPNVGPGYYDSDIWGEYFEKIKNFIPKGMTIYGEIVGYMTGSQRMVQKGYDYGCVEGENKLMIYRITTMDESGEKHEWDVQSVQYWTANLMTTHQEIAKYLHPIDILYHGMLKDLYPDIDTECHWHENVLEALKNDTEHFGMEKNEPMCKNKVPREGIVLRIDSDPIAEAFKLKCIKFLSKEAEMVDKGEIDVETEERY